MFFTLSIIMSCTVKCDNRDETWEPYIVSIWLILPVVSFLKTQVLFGQYHVCSFVLFLVISLDSWTIWSTRICHHFTLRWRQHWAKGHLAAKITTIEKRVKYSMLEFSQGMNFINFLSIENMTLIGKLKIRLLNTLFSYTVYLQIKET